MMNNLEKINVLDLLPQRPPFVMIDTLVSYTPQKTVTRLKVLDNNLFLTKNRLDEEGVIENVAQTCAARMGYINKFLDNSSVKIGFIGAINDFEVFKRPMVGDVLETTITIIEEVFNITLIDAIVMVGDKVIASGRMKISITEKEAV